MNSSSRAVSVKATVTDLGDVTVIQVEDKDVLKAMNESFAEEPAQQVDEKQLRAEIRSVFRKAMAQLSMPMFVAGSSAKDELSTVMSLLKVLKPTEAREAEHSTRLGAPLDTKL